MQNISHLILTAKSFDLRQNSEGYDKIFNCGDHRIIDFNCVKDVKNICAIKDSFFDKITIGGVLEYMDLGEQIEFMKECRRIITGDGIVKIRVPIIRDMMLVDYYGWNIDRDVNVDEGATEPDGGYLRSSPKCNFTPFSITSLAKDADLFVTEASLRNVYFYEIIFKRNRNLDFFTSIEIVHNIYYCAAHRIGTANELEYWAKCLDQGMKIEELTYKLNISGRDIHQIFGSD